jgi:hypothetical protein
MSFFSSFGKSSGSSAAKKPAAEIGPVTHEVLVEPAEGCVPKKVHHYDDAQKAKVRPSVCAYAIDADTGLRLRNCARCVKFDSHKLDPC